MYPFESVYLYPLGKYLIVQLLDCKQFYFQFLEESPYCSSEWLHPFAFPPTRQECSLFSTFSPTPVVSCVVSLSHSKSARVSLSVKHLTSLQVMISGFVSSSPASGSMRRAQSLEPASDSVSPSLSLPPCLSLSLSLSFSQK